MLKKMWMMSGKSKCVEDERAVDWLKPNWGPRRRHACGNLVRHHIIHLLAAHHTKGTGTMMMKAKTFARVTGYHFSPGPLNLSLGWYASGANWSQVEQNRAKVRKNGKTWENFH